DPHRRVGTGRLGRRDPTPLVLPGERQPALHELKRGHLTPRPDRRERVLHAEAMRELTVAVPSGPGPVSGKPEEPLQRGGHGDGAHFRPGRAELRAARPEIALEKLLEP